MDFRARPTGTGVTHHPKIVGLATVKNMNLRIEIGFAKQMRPMIVRFLVKLARLARAGPVNRRIKPLRLEISSVPPVIPMPTRLLPF